MVKNLILTLSLIFSIQFLTAQTLDKVVAVVGDEAIFESDIDLIYKKLQIDGELPEGNPRCQILKFLMDQKLLVAQAKVDSLDPDLGGIQYSVDQQISAFIVKVGGRAMVESFYNKTIEKIREEMIEAEIEGAYSSAMQKKITQKIKYTPSEVTRYFKSVDKDSLPIIPDQYMLYELVKKPNSEQAVIEVKEKLLEFRRNIIEGKNRFETLASMYSEDHQSARMGGELGLGPIDGYAIEIRLALSNMRVGQVSRIVETEFGYHILQLIEKQDETRFVNFRHILLRPQYTEEDKKDGFLRLDTIVRKILADSITFQQAAIRHSEDIRSRAAGGLLTNYNNSISPYFYKDEIYPDDYRAIEHLSVGEISEPYVSRDVAGNETYKVVMLKEFIPHHTADLKRDFGLLSRIYQNIKQNEALKKWVNEKAKTEYIKVDKKYEDCLSIDKSWMF